MTISTSGRPLLHTPKTFNESNNSISHTFSNLKVEVLNNSKNSLQNIFALKLNIFKNLKNKFFTLEKLTTLWRNLFNTSHSLGKTLTLFATLQTKSLASKGFSLSMLYKQNPWLLLVLTQCPFSYLVWAHNLLETTWNQARNEVFKVHEMEQLY